MINEDRFITDNWALAMSLKKTIMRSYPLLDRDSIESDVVYGLLKATRAYTPEKGSFSTLATICMKNLVKDSLRNWGKRQSTKKLSHPKRMANYQTRIRKLSEEVYVDPDPHSNYEIIRSKLSWEDRILIRLICWEGYSIVEASRLMGRHKAWGANRIYSLREKFQKTIERM